MDTLYEFCGPFQLVVIQRSLPRNRIKYIKSITQSKGEIYDVGPKRLNIKFKNKLHEPQKT